MLSCPSCRGDLLEGARFCSACGAPVDEVLAPTQHLESAALWPEGERRRLSLLFCDLVGSTALGQRLDVEDYTEVIEAYVGCAAGAIEQYGGYVAQVQGDGIVAYFGFPNASEDDAERAVLAGLAIQEALAIAVKLGQAAIAVEVRIGIHTGPVVVNEVGRQRRELLALGDTANTAARVESITPPGRVGISETTYRLVKDRFDITDGGRHVGKGIEHPIALFLVDGEASPAVRVPLVADSRPLFGRDQQIAKLADNLLVARDEGRGVPIAIVGEPGIGKSRVAASLVAKCHEFGCRSVTVACSAIAQSTAFVPIIELIYRLLGVPMDAPADGIADRFESSLNRHGIDVATTLPYLLALASLPSSSKHPLPLLGPELQRARFVAAVETVAIGVCSQQATLVLCEDFHWADPSTRETFTMLSERCSAVPLVLVFTSRPGTPLPVVAGVATIDRLDVAASRAIVHEIASEALLPDDIVDQLVERADGVPLFLEELTTSVIESGDLASIPTTLQDSLSARLDRLGPARVIAQVGALIGRDVDRSLLQEVVDLPASDFDAHIERLVKNGILLTDDAQRYTFKHALIQDAAAGSLVRRTRRRLHGDIADALERSFPAVVEAEPARLAHHCTEAGRGLVAIGHYRRAAARAGTRFANHEAADFLRRALIEYDALTDVDRTRALEIELRSEYGGPIAGVHGLLGDAVVANYARLEVLESEATDIGDQLAALLALTARYPQIAAMPALMDVGRKLLGIADVLEMPLFRGVGHMMSGLGATTVVPDQAIPHLEAVERLAEEGHLPGPFSDYAPDLLVLAVATKAIVLVSTGAVSAARERMAFAMHRAEIELEHSFSMGTALTLAATQHVWCNEPEQCRTVAARAIELARQYGFSNFEAMCMVQHGWAVTVAGGDGSDEVRIGLKLLTTSTMSSYPHQLRVAAMEALLRGETQQARAFIEEGRAVVEGNGVVAGSGEVGHLPQLTRISGCIARDEGRIESAASELRDAYDLAAECSQWLTAIQAASELLALDAKYQSDALALLRGCRAHFVGADDLAVVVAADALFRV